MKVPDLLHYGGHLFTYDYAGMIPDSEPKCYALPKTATEVGVVGAITSDFSASEASVEPEGEGAVVYERRGGSLPHLYVQVGEVQVGEDCWAYYFVGPG